MLADGNPADLFEANQEAFFSLCMREGGKTLDDCIAHAASLGARGIEVVSEHAHSY